MKKIVIIGATSAIAQAIARQFAEEKNKLFLIGRSKTHLAMLAADYAIRSENPCQFFVYDAFSNNQIEACLSEALGVLSTIDILVVAHGSLPNQRSCEIDLQKTLDEFQINAMSYIGLLTVFADYFEKQKNGHIIVFSSVAGDRGRRSNYLYGAAKSAISTFTSGLRARLSFSNVHVMTVKPGFVDTPMTKEFKKSFLWAQPNDVASCVINAMKKKKSVLYVPWFWKYIMLIIKWLPESLMKKL